MCVFGFVRSSPVSNHTIALKLKISEDLETTPPATPPMYAVSSRWALVVDEPREGDREEVGALPETAKLLVLHRTAHLELTAYIGGVAGGVVSKSSPDHLACGGIPELACLVSRGSQ